MEWLFNQGTFFRLITFHFNLKQIVLVVEKYKLIGQMNEKQGKCPMKFSCLFKLICKRFNNCNFFKTGWIVILEKCDLHKHIA